MGRVHTAEPRHTKAASQPRDKDGAAGHLGMTRHLQEVAAPELKQGVLHGSLTDPLPHAGDAVMLAHITAVVAIEVCFFHSKLFKVAQESSSVPPQCCLQDRSER